MAPYHFGTVNRLPVNGSERTSPAMSQTENVATELQAITAGLGRARTITASLDQESERVAARAAAAGFTAIAAAMSQVRTAINEVRARVHAATDAVHDAATAVRNAPNEASPQQVIAALTPAAERTDTIQREITAALGRADDTHRLVNQVLQGSNPGPMLTLINDLKQTLTKERHRAAQVKQHLTEATSQARQISEPGN